jgi:hypothetical protein
MVCQHVVRGRPNLGQPQGDFTMPEMGQCHQLNQEHA